MAKQLVTLPALPPSPPAFNYGQMSPNEVAALRAQADRIQKLNRTCIDMAIEIGRELISVKSRLQHGQFLPWVKSECGFTARTAQRYISAADFADGKSDTVCRILPATAVYQLSAPSTPPEVVREVLDRAKTGETFSPAEVTKMVDTAKAASRADAVTAPPTAREGDVKIRFKPTPQEMPADMERDPAIDEHVFSKLVDALYDVRAALDEIQDRGLLERLIEEVDACDDIRAEIERLERIARTLLAPTAVSPAAAAPSIAPETSAKTTTETEVPVWTQTSMPPETPIPAFLDRRLNGLQAETA